MTQKHELEINTGRRSFLRQGLTLALGATAMTAMPSVFAGTSANKERVLSFYNIHTGEKSKVLYWSNGIYVPEGVEEINHVLRDHYSGRVAEMDVRLMDALYNLHDKVDSRHSFEVISGYRSPKTNMSLRRADGQGGVAKKSYHTKGMAIDIRLPGTELSSLRKAALSMRTGGVGYYPDNNFLHVDVGRVRSWVGKS